MEASYEGGQGPERAAAPYIRMDGMLTWWGGRKFDPSEKVVSMFLFGTKNATMCINKKDDYNINAKSTK